MRPKDKVYESINKWDIWYDLTEKGIRGISRMNKSQLIVKHKSVFSDCLEC